MYVPEYKPTKSMNKQLFTLFLGLMLIITTLIFFTSSHWSYFNHEHAASSLLASSAGSSLLVDNFGNLPLSFEMNQGQVDSDVTFLSRGNGYTMYLAGDEAVMVLNKPLEGESGAASVVRLQLIGANPNPQALGQEELPGKINYFIGNDPAKWQTDVPTYAKVRYEEVYPGIDLVYYGNQGQLEYDFVVQPGADPGLIGLRFDGVDDLQIDKEGNIVLSVGHEKVIQQAPIIYQEIAGERVEVIGHYIFYGQREVGFALGEYNKNLPLIIDPILVYATYLGGINQEQLFGLDVDSTGSAYVTGQTSSTDFPVTAGSLDTTLDGSDDIYVAKIDSSGTSLVFATYIGGAGQEAGDALDVDAAGNVYVSGFTSSSDFPVTTGAFDVTSAGGDSFVLKLSSSGSSIVYASFLGGSSSERAWSVKADGLGQAHVVGHTSSNDFPTTIGAFDPTFNSVGCTVCQDLFAVKFDATGSSLLYGTFIGGSGLDYTYSADLDSSGNILINGFTDSPDFPVTSGAFQSAFAGATDAFLVKLNSSGTALVYGTYLGGNNYESSSPITGGVAVDAAGNAYVTGLTTSTDFPTTASAFDTTYNGGHDPYITKFDPTGNVSYSTFVGGTSNDYGTAIDVDSAGNAYITGQTFSSNLPITSDAFQSDLNGHSAYLLVMNTVGTNIIYGTFLGGNGGAAVEVGRAIAVGDNNEVYVAGATNSTDFPVTSGAFEQTYGGGTADGFLAKIRLPCTVTNLNDAGAGSLAAAIVCANNNPGPDTITFQVAGTINQSFQLPTLTDSSGGTLIDGTTAPGYAGAPVIVLDGPGTGSFVRGLKITSAENEVRALQIQDFSWGILLEGAGASGNKITRSYLGNDGSLAADTAIGVYIDGAPNNIIGTDGDGIDDSLEGNVIGGNSSRGISITGTGATGNVVAGNHIGIDAAGTSALPNLGQAGVMLLFGADNTRIGTNGDGISDVEERNIISGNPGAGIYVSGPDGTIMAGNYIGTDISGTTAVGNATFNDVFTAGIYLGGDNALIGTNGDGLSDALERNIISGNNFRGITINGGDDALIAGNYIGTDVTGATALANETGVLGLSGANVTVGTNGDGTGDGAEGNLISGNNLGGVSLQSGVTGVIAGNIIGLDASGTAVLPNDGSGLSFSGADKLVGTNGDGLSDVAERNVISGNTVNGINATNATNVVIAGNFVGTDITGSVPLGNLQWGLQINGDVRLGTNADGLNDAAERNVISGNGSTFSFVSAVLVSGSGATVSGNYIGTDATGTVAMGNNGDGIRISSGSNHIIGGTSTGAGNIIANSGAAGIAIPSSTSTNNLILGNDIYNNVGLGIDLGTGGVTTNDVDDGDTGANDLQNFPVITSVNNDASGLTIIGTLNSVPNSTFTLQFFSNSSCDPSGFGEGELVMGTTNVATDASGNASFSVTFPPATPGDTVTATATDVNNNTSEFSACFATTVPNQPPVADDDSYSTVEDTTLNVAMPGVLDGDFDADGDALTAVLDTTTSNGSLTLNTDGSFSYTPAADFNGSDSFTYMANDGTADSNIATVTLTVNAVNDAPVAVNDPATTDEGDNWTTRANMPTGRYSMAAVGASNGKVYAIGGISNGPTYSAVVEEYDPATDTWSIRANMPTARNSPGVVEAMNGKIYVIGGQASGTVFAATEEYDPATDTWTIRAYMPTARNAVAAAVASNGKIYVFGGTTTGSDFLATVEEYDPATDTWVTRANMPTARVGAGAATASNGKIYLIGGTNGSFLSTVEEYDPATDTWTTRASMPTARNVPGIVTASNGKIYAIGGFNGSSLGTVEEYDPATDTWIARASMPTARTPAVAAATNGKIYAMGGFGVPILDILEEYTPPNEVLIYTTDEDTALTVAAPGVLGNDTDPDGDALTAVLDTTTSNGSLSLNSDGSFDYIPDADFCGEESFTYHANDGQADSNVATVTIVVACINDAPVADDDNYSTDEDVPLNVLAPGVLDGDNDVDTGDTLTAVLDTTTSNGALTLNTDGSFSYTPAIGFCGATDSFTYHANDGTDDSNIATVTINVVCVNDAPVADDDLFSTNEDTTLNEPAPGVLNGDTDADGDGLTAVLDSTTSNGSLTLNGDGSFDYTPDPNFCGSDSFTYHANDGTDDSNIANVTIDVVCVNDPPEITVDQAAVVVDEGQTAVNSGSFSDIDSGSVTLTASVGIVNDNNDGTYSWSFNTTDGPAQSQTVTIFVDDGQDTAQASFALTVNNVAPTVDTITVPLAPVELDDQSSYTVAVTFGDPAGTLDEFYTCEFDLDYDGVTFAVDVTITNVTGTSCSTPLNYTEPGVYTVRVAVTDKDGDTGSNTAEDFIVIYDPSGGFVTGGGWIWSEPGWCQLDALCAGAEGKANFGFVSKYKKGANVPTGNTEFNFSAGNLNFHSDSYEWLVVNQGGANAQYKGSGTINGALAPNGESFQFMIWATDGNNKNPSEEDTFRIKIWYEDGGNEIVVYDNGFDQVIGGGNIKIHDGK